MARGEAGLMPWCASSEVDRELLDVCVSSALVSKLSSNSTWWVQQHVARREALFALIFKQRNWCSSGSCVTAKLVSENSQAFSTSAFAAGFLSFAEHFTFKTLLSPVGNSQTTVRTMKWPARSSAETCLLSHCHCFFLGISISWGAVELPYGLAPRMEVGELV